MGPSPDQVSIKLETVKSFVLTAGGAGFAEADEGVGVNALLTPSLLVSVILIYT